MVCSCRNKSGSVVGEPDEPYAPVWMERTMILPMYHIDFN